MTRVSAAQRLAAAALAVLVTTSTVWGMANFGYPEAKPVLLSAKQACA